MMQRRDMLKLILAGATAFATPFSFVSRAYAYATHGASDTRFLLVFLRGGYDAVNVVIPVSSSFYYESRPTLAIKKPNANDPESALGLSHGGKAVEWGLHPALKDTIYPLWQQKQVAFIPFAGTNNLSRSHFEVQDSVEEGLPNESHSMRSSGFLNRLSGVLGNAAAPVAFTDGLPVSMTGDLLIPNVSLKGTGPAPLVDRQMALLADMYAGTRFESLVNEGFKLRKDIAEQDTMMRSENRNAISARGFELEARRMAGLMRDKFNLGFIDVGGWDTHVNQGGVQGQLANQLGNLGGGLAVFARQMGSAWKNTVVVVISEFGRTFRENGTRGTDHGHGTVYWILGGAVHGGRIAGEQVSIERKSLNQDRDWPVLTEYRALLGGMFQRMYGLDATQLGRIFPGATPRDLDLV
ncbi:DUF1501 domain-containing protein [Nitrosomonas sp. Nm33]|uniref:DUF1501 domain-containing protein n=1 Tax=Nitrosomonas sp. Nm33 TaxID=133724 RepID=UPI001C409655|nr:DUF1501 domain-containing protein [Nitrosomonas sp. Nm33]